MIPALLGGLGTFLLGMVLLTDGLKALRDAAAGRLDPDRAMARVDALLGLDGVADHVGRAAHHLREDAPDEVRGEVAREAHSAPLPADVPPDPSPRTR